MRNKIMLEVLISILLVSCKEENSDIEKSDAILKWTAPYEVDGCGFFVIMKGVEYKPENENFIDDSFKSTPESSVTVQFKHLNKSITSFCEWGTPLENAAIEVESIKRN